MLVITTWALFSKPFPNTKGIIDRNNGCKYGNKFQVHERDYQSIISQIQTTWAFSPPPPPRQKTVAHQSCTSKHRRLWRFREAHYLQPVLAYANRTLSSILNCSHFQSKYEHYLKKARKWEASLLYENSQVFKRFYSEKRYEDTTSLFKSESLCPDDVTT